MAKLINKKLITKTNYDSGRDEDKVKYIVIHYTANAGTSATAYGNCLYFYETYRAASAHLFVDENEVCQCVELDNTAWHCGDNPYNRKNGATNTNSIGIEMVSHTDPDGNYYIPDETVDRTVELVRGLLELYPGSIICRHYDVTGKKCPAPWVDNEKKWCDFLIKVKEEPMTTAEKKEFDELKAKVDKYAKLIDKYEKQEVYTNAAIRWNYIDKNLPSWAKPTIQKLYNSQLLKGNSKGELELSYDFLRTLVLLDRAGCFGE